MLRKILSFTAVGLLLAGCATLNLKENPQDVQVRSVPSNAKVDIIDTSNNKIIASGNTPFSAKLPKRRAFFVPKNYIVRVSKDNFKTREFRINAKVSETYVIGNIPTDIIGWVLVDPGTGAMWDLKPEKNEYMVITDEFVEILLEHSGKTGK